MAEAAEQKHLVERAAQLAATWDDLTPGRARGILLAFIRRVKIHAECIDLQLRPARLVDLLRGVDRTVDDDTVLTISVPARLRRMGMGTRMIIDGVDPYAAPRKPDPSLVKLIVKARRLHERVISATGASGIREIARAEQLTSSYFTRVLRLSYLAPDIVKAILAGRQPPELTAAKMLRTSPLPIEWRAQRAALGFDPI